MSKEAMKLALEALEYIEHNYMSLPAPAEKAITALREALAEQPTQQQEPVACQYAKDVALPEYRCVGRCQYDTSPPAQRTWVGLSNEEINELDEWLDEQPFWRVVAFARAIEAKLKEKNT